MSFMKIASVVVWFNPEKLQHKLKAVDNILSYSKYCGKVFIVDNSSTDNSKLSRIIPNAVYIPLFRNMGIAYALNIGMNAAYKAGFEWVMTIDQDSVWDSTQIRLYLKNIEDHLSVDSEIVSYMPRLNLPVVRSTWSNIKLRVVPEKNISLSDEEYVYTGITSGNLIKTSVWKEIGGFDEKLFIDEVDTDFCFKILEHGYRILKINTNTLNQIIGNPHKTFFPRCVFIGSDFRFFHFVRNNYYIIHTYHLYASKCSYRKKMRIVFIEYCLLDKRGLHNLIIWFKAVAAYRHLIQGEK